jgi:hypothetical protein
VALEASVFKGVPCYTGSATQEIRLELSHAACGDQQAVHNDGLSLEAALATRSGPIDLSRPPCGPPMLQLWRAAAENRV